MAKFQYTALKGRTQIIKGEMEALNIHEAREKILKLGFTPTKVYMENVNSSYAPQTHLAEDKKITFLSLQEKIMFTSELQVLLSAGIPILEALNSIALNTPKYKIGIICNTIADRILTGATFAQALESLYGEVFGNVYTSLVKTGEDAGELDVTLERMLLLLRNQDKIKGKIISASIYPAILVVVMICVLVLFASFVFPRFAGLLAFNGTDMPFLANVLYGFFHFIEQFWWFVLFIFGAACGLFMSLFKDYGFKKKLDEFVLKIPKLSDFITYLNLSNFFTVLHISYEAGLPIMSGVDLANKSVGNNIIKIHVANAVRMIKCGNTLTRAFSSVPEIPRDFLTLIATGEKSGTLGKMLKDAANVIDKKLDMAFDILVRLIEPAMIIILGGFVLFIAVAFYQLYIGALMSIF